MSNDDVINLHETKIKQAPCPPKGELRLKKLCLLLLGFSKKISFYLVSDTATIITYCVTHFYMRNSFEHCAILITNSNSLQSKL